MSHELPKNESEKIEELRDMVRRALVSPEADEISDRNFEFIEKLKKDHPNIDDYKLFHVLGGGGFPNRELREFDLPNGEIEKYIRRGFKEE